MKQPERWDPYRFEVSKDERVSFGITESGTPRLITMGLDGATLEAPFEFTVTKGTGEFHFVESEFDFGPASGADAKYEITVSGSNGGSFSVPAIEKSTAVKNPGFTFKVGA